MSFVLQRLRSLAEDEDDDLWKLLSKLYGPALELSWTFPSWRPSRQPLTFSVLAFYVIIFPVHIWVLAMSIDCVRDDFHLLSMEVHYWLLLIFSLISQFLLNSRRKNMIQFHRSIMVGTGQYEAGNIYEEELPLKLEDEKHKQLLRFLFLPFMTLGLAGFAVLVPYLKTFDGKVHYNDRGANMKLPIPAWYPFPSHEGILSIIVVLGQFMTAGGLAFVIATMDLIIFRMTQAIIVEYQVLQYALETLMGRARRLHAMKYPILNLEKMNMNNVELQHCIGQCLKECVIHHHDIKRILTEFIMVVTWPAFLAYGFGTGVIGLSLINILEAKKAENYESIVIYTVLASAEVLNMFILSSFCESITTESKKLRQMLYFIPWHNLNTTNRKIMVNFQVGANEPVIIKVGGLVNASLDTFSSIMNTSYSFFNLVNANEG